MNHRLLRLINLVIAPRQLAFLVLEKVLRDILKAILSVRVEQLIAFLKDSDQLVLLGGLVVLLEVVDQEADEFAHKQPALQDEVDVPRVNGSWIEETQLHGLPLHLLRAIPSLKWFRLHCNLVMLFAEVMLHKHLLELVLAESEVVLVLEPFLNKFEAPLEH